MLCLVSALLLGLCAVLQAQQVSVTDKLTGTLGQEVTLPCTFTSNDPKVRVTQIMWFKNGTNIAVYSPQHGTYVTDPKRFQLQAPTQSSTIFTISPLIAADEGEYVCEVTTFPGGNRKESTRLSVRAVPVNSAEAVPVVAGEQEVTVATCTSANGRPPSQITWGANLPGNVSTTMTNNSDGTFTIVSHYRLIPTWTADGQHITCLIAYEAKETSIPLVLSVQYSPVVTIEGYDDNWHLNRNGAYLTCNARGNPPPTEYTWKMANGSPLPSSVQAKGHTLYVDRVDERVNTTFLCEVTNALGSRASSQDVLVREKPNSAGAGTTGGIIGGIIAAIVCVAVVVTVLMICRQQRKNQTAKDDDDLEGPPAYKPPPPSIKMQEEKNKGEELLPLKPPAQHIEAKEEMTPSKYWQPTEPELPSSLEDDYLEQMNPIYNELSLHEPESHKEEQGFVMSPAVYV
ncbi:nectin-2 isoform 2-T2 [Rhinophrynus dorsalis]